MILGFDISTSITGVSVLDYDGNIVLQEAIILNTKGKKRSLYEKADLVVEKIKKIKEKYNIEHVFIEDRLINVDNKRKNTKVLAMLVEFNGMISWNCYNLFKQEPIHLHPSSVRSLAGFKKNTSSKDNVKIQVVNFLLDKYNKKFIVEYKRTGSYKDHIYDIADSIMVSLAGLKTLKKKSILK